jgi:hypothetical protein
MALFATRVFSCLQIAMTLTLLGIGRTKPDGTTAFSAIERKSAKMGLLVNESMYVCRDTPRIGTQVLCDSYTFDVVDKFITLAQKSTPKTTSAWSLNSCQWELFWLYSAIE